MKTVPTGIVAVERLSNAPPSVALLFKLTLIYAIGHYAELGV